MNLEVARDVWINATVSQQISRLDMHYADDRSSNMCLQ